MSRATYTENSKVGFREVGSYRRHVSVERLIGEAAL
jgi:hypothetical protein